MAYEMLVGLNVKDDKVYTQYREAMRPILEEHGGGFRYDFIVSKVLRGDAPHEINRVFTIYFKDRESKDRFFAHEKYKKVKQTFFEASVAATTIISEYDRG